MNIEEFKQKRIEGRKQLLEKIIDTFKSSHPVAIHLFGSGQTGFKDEFSDIDIWITFEDNKINDILKQLNKIFKSIAPVLIRHHSKSWSPVGGSANSVIHDSQFGPYIVDYYISKPSETVIEINKNIHDSHTFRKDISLLVDLIFVSIKLIARKSDGDDFIKTLGTVHKDFRKKYGGRIKRRQIRLTFKSDYRLLSDLYQIASKGQRRAISKIKRYAKEVEASTIFAIR